VTYQVLDTETGHYGSPSWATELLGLTVADEFKCKASNLRILLSSVYTEPASVPTMTGGQIAGCEVETLNYELNWNAEVGRCWRQGSYGNDEATSVDLKDPVQTITVDRRTRDYLFRTRYQNNEAFGLKIDAIGAADGIEAGYEFFFEMYIPMVKFLEKPYQVSDGKWIEAGNLLVLKDTGNDWPTCVVRVQNEVTSYLA
jgi:hypothetical protein